MLAEKQVGLMFNKNILKSEELVEVEKHIFNFFTACRKVFEEHSCTNEKYSSHKMVCEFDQMLARYCKLPEGYLEMKKKVNEYEIGD